MAYAFENGNWKLFDDKITKFKDVSTKIGFLHGVETFYPLGKAMVYSHSSQNTTKTAYEFVFVFGMGLGGNEYRVWVPDLPSMFQFLKVIGASDGTAKYLEMTYFPNAMSTIADLSNLNDGYALQVEVKK